MRRVIIYCLLLLLFTVTVFATRHFANANNVKKQPVNATGFAVVELFTSEGCSSCPPADEAVAEILDDYKSGVYVLGFHVDYWNSLGWRDIYSNSAYSQRQQLYSNLFKLSSVYTPQAIVNGKIEFTGSNKTKLHAVVENELTQATAASITVVANCTDNKNVNVSYQLTPPPSNILNIALVQLHAQSNVQKGENSGRVLRHVNVVRDFKTISANSQQGNLTLQLPEGLSAKDCKIIAYVQDGQLYKILAATDTDIRF